MANGSLNKVQLIGNLGTEPEVKHFENGGSLARFPIATSESYTNKSGEKIESTEWHTIIARGGLVDVVAKYLKKGSELVLRVMPMWVIALPFHKRTASQVPLFLDLELLRIQNRMRMIYLFDY
jgi:hypothetical protein